MTRLVAATLALAGCLLVGCSPSSMDSPANAADVPRSLDTSMPASAPATAHGAPSATPPPAVASKLAKTPKAPREVAKKGEKLKDVQVAPPKTYGLFELPKPFKGAEFELVAKPYGRTPAAGRPSSPGHRARGVGQADWRTDRRVPEPRRQERASVD